MLTNLFIQNYALIDKLDIEFNKGLSIITGETGAGKSILLGALSLILGQRADSSNFKDNSKNCVVEGFFNIKEYQLQHFFEENELEYCENTVLRRIISETGKSRAFVNDMPVNLGQLKDLAERLVDIHSQHNNLIINSEDFQLAIIDSFAKHENLLVPYRNKYLQFRKLKQTLNQLIEKSDKEKSDLDYFQFQLDQLKGANLKENEQEIIEVDLEILTHAGEIQSTLANLLDVFSGDAINLIGRLKEGVSSLDKISHYFSKAIDIKQRLSSVLIELKDVNIDLQVLGNDIEFDPEKVKILKERLDLIYSLEQKHKVSDVNDLIQIREDLDDKIATIHSFDEEICKMEEDLAVLETELSLISDEISANRNASFPIIELKIISMLADLGMPNANFKIDIKPSDHFTLNGKDQVNFLFSANKNKEVQDVTKVISGGEMSRLMLSLKAIVSQSLSLPTIIFDEIDTGVSGDIADRMGNIIKEISENIQIINITHLPQIAAKGDAHYKVFKVDNEQSTTTSIKQLSPEERITEIAKMLSGKELTEAAISNAKILLNV